MQKRKEKKTSISISITQTMQLNCITWKRAFYTQNITFSGNLITIKKKNVMFSFRANHLYLPIDINCVLNLVSKPNFKLDPHIVICLLRITQIKAFGMVALVKVQKRNGGMLKAENIEMWLPNEHNNIFTRISVYWGVWVCYVPVLLPLYISLFPCQITMAVEWHHPYGAHLRMIYDMSSSCVDDKTMMLYKAK